MAVLMSLQALNFFAKKPQAILFPPGRGVEFLLRKIKKGVDKGGKSWYNKKRSEEKPHLG